MQTALYGAIIGDIIGSPYEGRFRVIKTKDFEFFSENCRFTDDTTMTIAVAEALLNVDRDAGEDTVKTSVVRSMQAWGRKYLNVGYSSSFTQWLLQENPKPYKKASNGSAMRVSSAGWLFDTIERTRQVARLTAEVSHNTPEGIRGAESIASAVFLARNSASKAEIKSYVEGEFGYDLAQRLNDIRPIYYPVVRCDGSVPEALISFLESENFEDALRNAVSLGGDSDTLAAMAGSVAEAFYQIPADLIEEALKRLPDDMREVVLRFNETIGSQEFGL